MMMNKQITLISQLACGLCLMTTAANADTAVEPTQADGGDLFWAYATISQYKGYGPYGAIDVESTRTSDLYTRERNTDFKVSGELSGVTLGYAKTFSNDDLITIEASYLEGSPDCNYYMLSHFDYDDGSYYDKTTNGKMTQDVDQYRFSAEFSPSRLSFLSFGAEMVYTKTAQSYRYVSSIDYYDVSETDPYSFLKDGSSRAETSATDLLATIAFTPGNFVLFESGRHSFSITPKAKLGLGYSFRDADNGWSYRYTYSDEDAVYSGFTSYAEEDAANADYGVDSHFADCIPDDGWVYELRGEVAASYQVDAAALSLALGYRYKSDFDDSDNFSKGFYGGLGFSYSW